MTAPQSESSALERRVESLERHGRRLTGLVALLSPLCLVLLAWRPLPPGPRRREARGFPLRDAHGVGRASLGFGGDGAPTLRLDNPAGKARAMMWVKDDGSVMLRLTDSRGVNRAEMMLDADGTPRLGMSDREGSNRAA